MPVALDTGRAPAKIADFIALAKPRLNVLVVATSAAGYYLGSAGTPGGRFDERRVGLDHLSIACGDRAEVEAWERHLDELGVEHGELVDAGYGHVLTSRDPDGIPVEFFAPVAQ